MNNRELGNIDSNQLAAEIPFATVKAWFFDLDGTLMDTDNQAVDSLAHRLRFLGSSSAQRLARYLIMKSETPLNFVVTLVIRSGYAYV